MTELCQEFLQIHLFLFIFQRFAKAWKEHSFSEVGQSQVLFEFWCCPEEFLILLLNCIAHPFSSTISYAQHRKLLYPAASNKCFRRGLGIILFYSSAISCKAHTGFLLELSSQWDTTQPSSAQSPRPEWQPCCRAPHSVDFEQFWGYLWSSSYLDPL